MNLVLTFTTSVNQLVSKLYCLIAIIILASFSEVQAQKIERIEQVFYGKLSSITHPVDWISKNLSCQNTHLTDGKVTPFHLEVICLVNNGIVN